jgi:hypothetical protein
MKYFLSLYVMLSFTVITACASTSSTNAPTEITTPTSTSLHISSSVSSTPTLTSTPIPTAAWINTPESLNTALPTSKSPVFRLLELTSPVLPDGIATVIIQTTPGVQCSLEYRPPDGTLSHAEGLETQIANAQGICWWTWKLWMGGKTPPSGKGQLIITVDGVWQFFVIVVR